MANLNLGLLVIEAVVYFTAMVSFLHFRNRIGLGVFLTALGVMHFMETYLAAVFYVQLPFGVVSPGSSVFFAGKLMVILMLYLEEDAATVRQPIYGLFLGNLLTVAIAWFVQFHATVELTPGRGADVGFLKEMGWLMIWGTTILYLDSLGIILLYERLGGLLRRWIVLRFMIAGFAVLTFDQVGFFTGLHLFVDAPMAVFWGGWKAKMLAVCIYSALFALYQFKIRRYRWMMATQRAIGDVFNDLTFRERYHDLLERTGRDMLTGAFDRNRMEIEGPQLVRDSQVADDYFTAVLIDVDHFKEVNDRFGHLEGDGVLKAVAAELSGTLRSSDRLFRFGGEEFVVLAPRTNHAEGLLVSDRLRAQVEKSVRNPDGQPITISCGVATLGEDGANLNALLGSADARLYHAKRSGRNCVVGRTGKVAAS